jgi:ParB-like chromosome segregation protein Spo0J
MEKEMMEINIDDIRTNPYQAREYFDERIICKKTCKKEAI